MLLETDPTVARARAREHMGWYLTPPELRREPALARLRATRTSATAISDRLVDAIVAWGDEAAIRARVQAHLDAGADHVAVQPLEPDRGLGLEQLRRSRRPC